MLRGELGLETIMWELISLVFVLGFTVIYHGDRSRSAQMFSMILQAECLCVCYVSGAPLPRIGSAGFI